jgi:hypothetical protein
MTTVRSIRKGCFSREPLLKNEAADRPLGTGWPAAGQQHWGRPEVKVLSFEDNDRNHRDDKDESLHLNDKPAPAAVKRPAPFFFRPFSQPRPSLRLRALKHGTHETSSTEHTVHGNRTTDEDFPARPDENELSITTSASSSKSASNNTEEPEDQSLEDPA